MNSRIKLVYFPAPVLMEPCRPVKEGVSPEMVAGMERILEEKEGLGLAAPQVGVSLRFALCRDEEERVHPLINPIILEHSSERVVDWEGCLSMPELIARVPRSPYVVVEATHLDGERFRMEASGLFARVIQHELDHLDGVLLFDRALEGSLEYKERPVGVEEAKRCFE
ncbi:peptide deformylase [bacterium]|nr:peptide deformylase [bacterium]